MSQETATEEQQPMELTWPDSVDIQLDLPSKKTLLLPSVNSNETLSAIRQALADFQESAFLTAFHWELTSLETIDGEIIPVPREDNSHLCSDFSELNQFLQPGVKKIRLEVVQDNYDVKKLRQHVKRTKDIFQRPYLISALPKEKKEQGNGPATESEVKTNEVSEAVTRSNWEPLPKIDKLLEPVQLGQFYDKVFNFVQKIKPDVKLPTLEPLSSVVKNVFVSGWNPVPAFRKIQGDLLYIEVSLATEGTVYITGTARGFYVNKSNRNTFDPRPTNSPHFHHDLFDTLYGFSASLKTTWANFCKTSDAYNTSVVISPLDNLVNVYTKFTGDVATLPTSTWTVPAEKENKTLSYDMLRTQEYLSDLHGSDELGAPREWNDEIQSIRSLAAQELAEKVLKARLEYRIISEFSETCKKIAMAISDGLIAPLTYADPNQSDIYVYNGIFVSRAEDTKDTFKICDGEEAARKVTARDMANQKIIRALEIEGLGTVLCAMVDYKGIRYVGQSIIPGIFNQGENCTQLLYGGLEPNKNFTVKASSLDTYKKLAEKLHLPRRNIPLQPFKSEESVAAAEEDANQAHVDPLNKLLKATEASQSSSIRVDEVDNVPVDAKTNSIPHIGPIESKLLKGSDGRIYGLEFMRLTPRDANYVAGEKGSKKIPEDVLAKGDASLGVSYVLRQELIQLFIQRKINLARQALLLEAVGKEKAALEGKAAAEKKEEVEVSKDASASKTDALDGDDDDDEEAVQIVKEAKDNTKLDGSLSDEALQQSLATEYAEKFKQITAQSLGIEINPNVFLPYEIDISSEIISKDEALVCEISTFLYEHLLPMVTKQIREGEFFPRELNAMVQFLHRMGVNLRYLGQLAKLASEQEKEDADLLSQGKQRVHTMPYYWLEFLIIEMIARSTKHLLNKRLREDRLAASSPAATVASLLNHILSILIDAPLTDAVAATTNNNTTEVVDTKAATTGNKKNKKKTTSTAITNGGSADVPDLQMTIDACADQRETLEQLEKLLQERFLYDFTLLSEKLHGKDTSAAVKALEGKEISQSELTTLMANSILRTRLSQNVLIGRICQQCGIIIATKNYNFKNPNPFKADDIITLVPKVKNCEPESYLPEFSEILNSSMLHMQQGNAVTAYECAQQAMDIISQITGTNHIQAFQAADQLTAVLINSADVKSATHMAGRSLALAATVLGLDSQDTLLHYIQMGVLHTELNNPDLAMEYLDTARYLIQLVGGDHHPELSNIYMRMSALYEMAGDFDSACQCLLRARVYTGDLLKNCMLTISIASLCYRYGRIHEAVATQKNGYRILKELVAEDDERLVEVKKSLETYIRASVNVPLPTTNIFTGQQGGVGNKKNALTNQEDGDGGAADGQNKKKRKNKKSNNKAKK